MHLYENPDMIINPYRYATGGGGSFSPDDLSDLVCWLKADVGVLESDASDAEDGDTVTDWEDQSGNSNDCTVADGIYRSSGPHVEVNGDGDQDAVVSPAIWTGSVATFFIVLKSNDSVGTIFTDGTGSKWVGGFNFGTTNSGATCNYHIDGVDKGAISSSDLGTDGFDNSWHVITVAMSAMSSWTRFYLFDYGSFGTVGDVKEIIAYDATLSSGDREDVEDYLGTRHSITITH